jgi:hypothetical protein
MSLRTKFATLAMFLATVCVTTNAGAVWLIVTNAQNSFVNPNIPAGSVLYTLSVEVFQGEGLTPGPLSVNLSFSGAGAPAQLTKAQGGVDTLQSLQNNIDNGVNTARITQGLNADSWIYGSPTGQLTSTTDVDPVPAPANPKLSGPWLAPNPLALVWSPHGTGFISTNTTGAVMSISGSWGNPDSSTPGDPLIALSQVGRGYYPLAQILVPAGGRVTFANGPDLGITFHGKLYDVRGSLNTDGTSAAGAYLSDNPLAFTLDPNAIPMVLDPEPSTIVLAGLGVVGMLISRRRFRRR